MTNYFSFPFLAETEVLVFVVALAADFLLLVVFRFLVFGSSESISDSESL